LLISGLLGAFETAMSQTTDSALFAWQDDSARRWQSVHDSLNVPVFAWLPVFRWLARLLNFFQNLRVAPFIDYNGGGVPLPNRERAISFCLTVGMIIDVNLTVMTAQLISKTPQFQNDFLPSITSIFDKLLPYAGSDGVAAVGVSFMLLLLVELVPKKIAMRHELAVIRWGSWWVAALYWLCIPAIIAQAVEKLSNTLLPGARRS
jgi:hypothetical protein